MVYAQNEISNLQFKMYYTYNIYNIHNTYLLHNYIINIIIGIITINSFIGHGFSS